MKRKTSMNVGDTSCPYKQTKLRSRRWNLRSNYRWEKIPRAEDFSESVLDKDTISVLEAVYNTYGSFDGGELERLTHSEKPWQEAREGMTPLQPGTRAISTATMCAFYGERYDRPERMKNWSRRTGSFSYRSHN